MVLRSDSHPLYYYRPGDKEEPCGPFSAAQLKKLADEGTLCESDIVWKAGSDKRHLASAVKGLFNPREERREVIVATLVETAPPPPLPKPTPPEANEPPIMAAVITSGTVDSLDTDRMNFPLEDPMREISDRFSKVLRIMFYCLVGLSVMAIVPYILSQDSPVGIVLGSVIYFLWILFFAYWVNLVWWRAFAPRRVTDVFYLRSFQNDEVSWPIRVAMQDALGDQVRMSGIRDPRRRVMTLGDGLSPWMRAMRHCTPKFMDLEAEDDWKARLWNSLQCGTMAVVDLSEVTPFVLDEVGLVHQAIGIERAVFLGVSPQQDEVEIRALLKGQLGEDASAKARVLLFPNDLQGDEKRRWLSAFKLQVKELYENASKLPSIAKQPVPKLLYVQPATRQPVAMSRRMIHWMIGFQIVLVGIQIVVSLVARAVPNDGLRSVIVFLGSVPFTMVNFGFFFYNLAAYIRDVGIRRRQIKALVLVAAMVIAVGPVFWGYFFSESQAVVRPDSLSVSEGEVDFELLQKENASSPR